MLFSPRKNGLNSLFKEVKAFKESNFDYPPKIFWVFESLGLTPGLQINCSYGPVVVWKKLILKITSTLHYSDCFELFTQKRRGVA